MKNSHLGGLLVIGVAVFLIVMGIKGSQHSLFPQLFGSEPTYGVYQDYAIHAPGTTASQQNTHIPAHNKSCPSGYIYTAGDECVPLVGPHAAP